MVVPNRSTLEQLRQYTTIVADTGDFNVLESFKPQDGTTNPSHILASSKKPIYSWILQHGVEYGKIQAQDLRYQVEYALLDVLVGFGCEVLRRVPGRVSTEVDAIHSYDCSATVNMARKIINLYEERQIPRERILIKIASTWEGFHACKILESEGIHCNMTLVFSMPQAVLAAGSKATLISPFVGRSMDWFHKMAPGKDYTGPKDPGVKLVTEIYRYYKENNIKTEIMAASLRNIDECVHLAGVDFMTINVGLLGELAQADYPVRQHLRHEHSVNSTGTNLSVVYANNEPAFRMALFLNRMATDKIDESLRIFLTDGAEMKEVLKQLIQSSS